MAERTPHPANIPGDFYVENGCCTMCEMPFAEAPGLFGRSDEESGFPGGFVPHCYVSRQPQTRIELEQMVSAIRCAELSCIRYRGHDRVILRWLLELGETQICDHLPADMQEELGQKE